MPRMYPFITGIKADYLISNHFIVDNFIFIIKANAQSELKCDFLCCSIFEKGDRDYETNQKARTLMKKERIHIPSNTTDILLDRLSVQTRPEDKTTDSSDNTEASLTSSFFLLTPKMTKCLSTTLHR